MLSPRLSCLTWLTADLCCSMVCVMCTSHTIQLFVAVIPVRQQPVVMAGRCAAMRCACIGSLCPVDAWLVLFMVCALLWQHNL